MTVSTVGRLTLPMALALGLLAAVASATLAPSEASAQVTPADSAAVLLSTATRFERDGRWPIAEAIYVLITEQYGATPAAAEARARLSAAPSARLERISRVELQVFGTTYGLWLGVAVPIALGANDPEAFGAGLLIGGPLGLFGSRAALRAYPLSEGQARAVSWGGIWGTWQGLGWAEVFDVGVGEVCDSFGCFPSEDNTEEIFASMIVGGLAGIGTGAVIARNPVRSGVSSGAQGGSMWGSVYGAMIAGMLDSDGDAVLVSSLLAGNVGLIAGAALAARHDLSRSRVRMISLGALVGGVGGVGIDLLIQPDDEAAALGIPLVMSLAGVAIAAHATRNDAPDTGGPDGAGAALLGWSDGGLSLGTPLPMPTFLPADDANGRTTWRPGVTVDLFRARFF
jgi:hypothetical protein